MGDLEKKAWIARGVISLGVALSQRKVIKLRREWKELTKSVKEGRRIAVSQNDEPGREKGIATFSDSLEPRPEVYVDQRGLAKRWRPPCTIHVKRSIEGFSAKGISARLVLKTSGGRRRRGGRRKGGGMTWSWRQRNSLLRRRARLADKTD